MINIVEGTGGGALTQIVETKKFDESSTSTDDIYGRAPFTRGGINEIGIRPGIYLKTGLNFEFGYVKTRIKALETGAALEFFRKELTLWLTTVISSFISLSTSVLVSENALISIEGLLKRRRIPQ